MDPYTAGLGDDPWAAFQGAFPEGIPLAPNGQPLTVQQTPGDPNQWYTLQDGTQVQERDLLPGDIGYKSAPLVGDGTRTKDGDIFNAFRGYVSGDGGSFGGDDGTVDGALRALEAMSLGPGQNARDVFGFGPDVTLDQIRAAKKTMGGIANRDEATLKAALTDANPFIRRTAQAYDLGFGSQGLPEGADYNALKAQQTLDRDYASGRKVRTDASLIGTHLTGAQDVAPVQSATNPAPAGQGFGTGWQNPYSNYRPVQPAANPMGSPGLNRVQARPLTGGAY